MSKKNSSVLTNSKYLAAFTAIITIATVFAGCTQLNFSKQISQENQQESQPIPAGSTEIPTSPKTEYSFTAAEDEQLALDLIVSQATIETADYGTAGKFVTSINGLAGNNQNYWAFYVNGEYAQKGASQTILKKGDIIKFTYEAVTLEK